jgi:photosystem II stability/assembly factor-like uncharacterized protein
MAFTPSFWGGTQTSEDYQMLTDGDSPVSTPVDLTGHGMTSFGQELSDPLDVNVVTLERGRKRNRSKRIRQAEQQAITFTLLMGNQLWSKLLHRSRQALQGCLTTIYARRLCAPEDQYAHAFIFDEVAIDPATRVNDFIPIDGTATIAEWQADARASRELIVWSTAGYLLTDYADALYAVALATEDCADCISDDIYQVGFAVGGNGTDAGVILKTTNRFGSVSEVSNASAAGDIFTCIWTEGDVVLLGFADDASVAAGTTGGTFFSTDQLSSAPTIDSGITEPIRGVTKFNGQYVAVGGTGVGAPKVYLSTDGTNWTALSSAVLTGTNALTGVDVDPTANRMYIVGEGGTLLKGSASGTSISLVDISANLPGAPGILNKVKVLAEDHVAVAGASGYYAESFDGGVTWTEPNVPGSTAITALAGTKYRTMVGAGTSFYERSVLSDYSFNAKALAEGSTITGDVRDIYNPVDSVQDSFNYFVAVTDDGEIVVFRPQYPNA